MNKLWRRAEEKQKELQRLEHVGLKRTNENYYVHVTNILPHSLLQPTTPQKLEELLREATIQDASAYQGFYGCANLCDFCPFGTRIGPEAKDTYELMKEEHALLANITTPQIHALYFGGGTPSIIPNEKLDALLSSFQKEFPTNNTGEWKFEIYPKKYSETYIREKLSILRAHAFTDIEIDIQSANQQSLDVVGRTNSSFADFERLLEILSDEGFYSITTTLMAGLPYETRESFAEGLMRVSARDEVTSVIVYPIFQKGNKKILGDTRYASVKEKDVLTVFAHEYLEQSGFHPNMDKYYVREKPKPLSIEEKFRGGTHIGFGTSARGCFTDTQGTQWHYHNTPDVHEYNARLAKGILPVERMSPVSQAEQGKHYFLQELCTLNEVDATFFNARYNTDVLAEMEKPLAALEKAGVITRDQTKVQIQERFRTEEIIGHLRSANINEAMAVPSYANDGRNLNWGIHIPQEDKQQLLSTI